MTIWATYKVYELFTYRIIHAEYQLWIADFQDQNQTICAFCCSDLRLLRHEKAFEGNQYRTCCRPLVLRGGDGLALILSDLTCSRVLTYHLRGS